MAVDQGQTTADAQIRARGVAVDQGQTTADAQIRYPTLPPNVRREREEWHR